MRRAPEGAPIVGECAKLVCQVRILIEDEHRSRNQQRVEAGQSEKRRRIQVAVVVNDEAGFGSEPVQKAWQGSLEPVLDEADPFVVDLRHRAAQVKGSLGEFFSEVLWQSFKGIEANETALRIAVHLRPEPDAMSLVDADHLLADCLTVGAAEESFKYKKRFGMTVGGLPYAIEAAFAYCPEGDRRTIVAGVNFSGIM